MRRPPPAIALAKDIARFPQTCLRADRLSALRQWDLDEEEAIANEMRGGLEVIASGETLSGATRFASGVGRHGALLTFGIDVLEEMLPRQLFTSLDHTCDPTVRDPDMHLTPTLAFEEEAHARTLHLDVAIAQRGQSKRLVLPRVLLVADSRIGRFEQANDCGHDLILRKAVPP